MVLRAGTDHPRASSTAAPREPASKPGHALAAERSTALTLGDRSRWCACIHHRLLASSHHRAPAMSTVSRLAIPRITRLGPLRYAAPELIARLPAKLPYPRLR